MYEQWSFKNFLELSGIKTYEKINFCFDVDELLISNKGSIKSSYIELLDSRDILIEDGEVFEGRNLFDILQNIKEKYVIQDSIDSLAYERKNSYITELIESPPIIKRGAIDFISMLKRNHNCIISYATSSERTFMDILLATSLRDVDFDFGIAWDESLNKKPSGDLYQKCIDISKIESNQTVAFEDSVSGVYSALSCGIKTILIPSRISVSAYFLENKDVKIAYSFKHLLTGETE